MSKVGILFGDETFEVYHEQKKVLYQDLAYINWDENNKKAIILGHEAKNLINDERNSGKVIKIFNNGTFVNFDAFKIAFEQVFNPIKNDLENEDLIIGYPGDLNEENIELIQQMFLKFNPNSISMYPNMFLLAIGSGINIKDDYGTILLNFGYSRTTAAIIADNKIINFKVIGLAEDFLNEEISMFLKENYQIVVDQNEINNIKYNLANLTTTNRFDVQLLIQGLDLITNEFKKILVKGDDVRKVFSSLFSNYRVMITRLLEGAPTRTRMGIAKNGLVITGQMARINGVENYFEGFFEFPTKIVEEKIGQNDVIKGALEIDLN